MRMQASVTEDGAVLSGTAPTEAVFAAGAATVDLAVATADDEVVETASVVTVALAAGTGYVVDANAAQATVTVEDDDAAPALTGVRLDPGVSGRGVSLSIAPVWGAASGGVEQLWSAGTTSGLAADDDYGGEARLQAELGYGLRSPIGHGVLTPYAGLSLGEADGRMYRVGVRWHVGPQAWLALDGNRDETSAGNSPTNTATLRAAVRF